MVLTRLFDILDKLVAARIERDVAEREAEKANAARLFKIREDALLQLSAVLPALLPLLLGGKGVAAPTPHALRTCHLCGDFVAGGSPCPKCEACRACGSPGCNGYDCPAESAEGGAGVRVPSDADACATGDCASPRGDGIQPKGVSPRKVGPS